MIGSVLEIAAAALRLAGSRFADGMIEQEAARRLPAHRARASRRRARLPIAFQVHTVSRLTPSMSWTWPFTRPMMAFDPDPVAVGEAERRAPARWHVEAVLAGDLAQPGVLRAPRVVHVHRPLRDARAAEMSSRVDRCFLERRIPERQRIEIGLDALALASPAARPCRGRAPPGGISAAARDRAGT